MDALFLAEIDNLLLGQAGVVLNLVDGGDNGGVREKLLEILLAVLHHVIMLEAVGQQYEMLQDIRC